MSIVGAIALWIALFITGIRYERALPAARSTRAGAISTLWWLVASFFWAFAAYVAGWFG